MGTKILKRGRGKLGEGVGSLKKRGLEPPYELCDVKELAKTIIKSLFYLNYYHIQLYGIWNSRVKKLSYGL